jgi:hypothetical protein
MRVRPNDKGNRRADERVAEDQTVCRRVRLTVRLGRSHRRQMSRELHTNDFDGKLLLPAEDLAFANLRESVPLIECLRVQ